ncbi:MAG: alpha-glucosidase [Bacilli bacterium]|nr:alpha-glucosidase [Bacilli bacterium]MDD4076412.1 alpha-glucosidase [Bacilli bacterium]
MKRAYKEAIVYQIYPRSFKDSNNDGIGDLRGIIEKLDYLQYLGINTVWLSPVYSSPMDDNGYDISDYCNILPEYGTLEDFKEMIFGMHKRGIKLIMDLVINHSSDEHPWFLAARRDINSPYRDYYFFRKGNKNGPPNNWTSFFGGSAWEYNPDTDDYYLHLFSRKQPDLNWENLRLREEIKKILKFWLDLGVDGFRCDVINIISKNPDLPDGKSKLPILRGKEHYLNGPKIHKYLNELKSDVFSYYDMFTVGETVMITPETALTYIEEGCDELNMVFQFDHMGVDNYYVKWFLRKFKPKRLKKTMRKWQTALDGKGWNSLYFENHDQPRSVNRFGNLCYRIESAKMLATYLYFQQGTPFIYQGQEIAMTNAHFTELSQYRDVETFNIYRLGRKLGFSDKRMMKKIKYMSRDNARTPMQWNADEHAGFTKGIPWIEVNQNYKLINVEKDRDNPDSILNHYRKIITLRKEYPVAIYGNYYEYYLKSNKVAVYERNFKNDRLLVVVNFTSKKVKFKPPYDLSTYQLILNNYDEEYEEQLLPYQAKVYYGKVFHDSGKG